MKGKLAGQVLDLVRRQPGILSAIDGPRDMDKSGRRGVQIINGQTGRLTLRVFEEGQSQVFFVRTQNEHSTAGLCSELKKLNIKINPGTH